MLYSDFKFFANSLPSASNFKGFFRSLEQFFLTVGQNNFGNKTPLHTHVYKRTKGFRVGLMILRTFGGHDLTNNFVFRAKFKCFLAADFILFFRVL